jgi:predicted AAA+ superfamily ATPase
MFFGRYFLKRNAFKRLVEWKKDPCKKPLLLKGAKRVGKTWLMREFGNTHYGNCVYFNFADEDELYSIFENSKNPHEIIKKLELLTDRNIMPEKTLIVFDEIQECPLALNSLKYFSETENGYHIIAAGNRIDYILSRPEALPADAVDSVELYPMSFDEFLEAANGILFAYYSQIKNGRGIEEALHNRLTEAYCHYFIVGGLPECVSSWITHKDFQRINQLQKELIALYRNCFIKSNDRVTGTRILLVFQSIVSQLARNSEKFIYSSISEKARGRELGEAIEWLVSAGMLNRVYGIPRKDSPSAVSDRPGRFKLFFFDTGLLKNMADINNYPILMKKEYPFRRALTKNFVLQQFRGQFDGEIRFSDERGSEADFIIQNGSESISVEIKDSEDGRGAGSRTYIKKHIPKKVIIYSKYGYAEEGDVINLPLYLVNKTKSLL